MAIPVEIEENELNLTPLVDVVFNLLIFFLLSATYLNEAQEMELRLPRVGEAAPLSEAPQELTLDVYANGEISLAGERTSLEELRNRLLRIRSEYPDQVVAIRGDANAAYERVAQVMSVCREAGIATFDVLVLEE